MHPLYTEKYFRDYLKFSLCIFQRQYPVGTSYADHPEWNDFLSFLKQAGVQKILVYEEMYVGSISVKYGYAPITESSAPEEKVRQKHSIIQEILLAS